MNAAWHRGLRPLSSAEGPLVRVLVTRADGSAPRGPGTAMLVSARASHGTIGGGALEFDAIGRARELLGEAPGGSWRRTVRHYPLGPSLGQCCGGHVRLLFERFGDEEVAWFDRLPQAGRGVIVRPVADGIEPVFAGDRGAAGEWPLGVTRAVRDILAGRRPTGLVLVRGHGGAGDWIIEPLTVARTRLMLYGAGHVGRALVRVIEDLPFDTGWVDVDRARFPDPIPGHVEALITPDPAAAARTAPAAAVHLVMTFSHALDLAICQVLLARGDFRYLGLIGSATKRARFEKRLVEMGIARAQLDRLVCPIGLAGVTSKEPAAIAVSVAADLMQRLAAEPHAGTDGNVAEQTAPARSESGAG